jgi:hypothetical protein
MFIVMFFALSSLPHIFLISYRKARLAAYWEVIPKQLKMLNLTVKDSGSEDADLMERLTEYLEISTHVSGEYWKK